MCIIWVLILYIFQNLLEMVFPKTKSLTLYSFYVSRYVTNYSFSTKTKYSNYSVKFSKNLFPHTLKARNCSDTVSYYTSATAEVRLDC